MMHRAYLCKQAGFVPAHPAVADEVSVCQIHNIFKMLHIRKIVHNMDTYGQKAVKIEEDNERR
jgi:hypothetical protein